MSSINKTYVNYEEWKLAKKFADETKDEQIRCLLKPKEMEFPDEFIYSFNSSDFEKYDGQLIYFFTEFENWQKFKKIHTNLCRYGLPDYILNMMK